ncbi:MAG: hypothetical protein COV60_01645, partial [Candidatus Magasanikbacteria bacterium CG11_big_fil_rev_8_21_14_0_20_43_7]
MNKNMGLIEIVLLSLATIFLLTLLVIKFFDFGTTEKIVQVLTLIITLVFGISAIYFSYVQKTIMDRDEKSKEQAVFLLMAEIIANLAEHTTMSFHALHEGASSGRVADGYTVAYKNFGAESIKRISYENTQLANDISQFYFFIEKFKKIATLRERTSD